MRVSPRWTEPFQPSVVPQPSHLVSPELETFQNEVQNQISISWKSWQRPLPFPFCLLHTDTIGSSSQHRLPSGWGD